MLFSSNKTLPKTSLTYTEKKLMIIVSPETKNDRKKSIKIIENLLMLSIIAFWWYAILKKNIA